MKRNEETMLAICDAYASGLSLVGAAASCGLAQRTLFQWLRESSAQNENYVITYLDEPMQFATAMALARKMVHMEARSRFEKRSLLGHDQPIFFQGMPTWKPDPRCVGMDEDLRDMLGYPRDGFLRDANGACIQNTEHVEPPVAAILRLLETSFPEEYTPTQRTINGINADTGVQRATPITGERLTVPPKPIRPALEDKSEPVVEGTFDEVEPEPEPGRGGKAPGGIEDLGIDEMLGDDINDMTAQDFEQPTAPAPGPMIKGPSPDIAPSSRPISPTLAGLLRRGGKS